MGVRERSWDKDPAARLAIAGKEVWIEHDLRVGGEICAGDRDGLAVCTYIGIVWVTPEIVGGPERTLNTTELLVAVPTGDGNLSSSPGTEQVGGNVRRHSAVGDHTRGKSSRGGARFAFHWTAVAPVRPPPFTVKTRAVVAGASVEIGESELTRGPVNGKGLGRRF